ncbi:MAG: FAD-binding oxidoreductase [Bacteroidota bacterium]
MAKRVHNWGKYPSIEAPIQRLKDALPTSSWIARGMGRCYGDSALSHHMVSNLHLNHFLDFDAQTGTLTCESGVTYRELLQVFVPKGWFPPVTPGTQFVTLGGAIASDVHGKNHHVAGSIRQHILEFDLLTGTGEVLRCSPTQYPEVFDATFGGMGLTGVILSLKVQLKAIETAYVDQVSIKARHLEEILDLFDEFEEATYSVAWIDTLAGGKNMGRSILQKGEHTRKEDWGRTDPLIISPQSSLSVPLDLPSFTLNKWSISAFNFLYYHKQFSRQESNTIPYLPFFYPLDSIFHWNRIYGKKGFTQYQLVIPKAAGKIGIPQVLRFLHKHNLNSFLSVLKMFGEGEGLMSFPMAGYTLTLDIPIRARIFPLLDELDRIVLDHGGRLYLTKDARMKPEVFRQMYPQWEAFQEIIQKLDPTGNIQSLQSQRLQIRT